MGLTAGLLLVPSDTCDASETNMESCVVWMKPGASSALESFEPQVLRCVERFSLLMRHACPKP